MRTIAIALCLALTGPGIIHQSFAADQPAGRGPTLRGELVITNGTFEQNGRRVPATVRRIVDALSARYRNINITIVGADDIVIPDVRIRLRPPPDGINAAQPPVEGMLKALQAASRNAFDVEAYGRDDFLITAARGKQNHAEVFKLGQLLGQKAAAGRLQEIKELETHLSVLRKQGGPTDERVRQLAEQLEFMRALQKEEQGRAGSSARDPAKLIAEIEDVVRDTLTRLNPGAPPPELKYHPGTTLLVVIGSPDAIDITRKVIDALR